MDKEITDHCIKKGLEDVKCQQCGKELKIPRNAVMLGILCQNCRKPKSYVYKG